MSASEECLSPSSYFKLSDLMFPSSILKARSGNKQIREVAKVAVLYELYVILFSEMDSSVSPLSCLSARSKKTKQNTHLSVFFCLTSKMWL